MIYILDAAVSAFIPVRFLDCLIHVCEAVQQGIPHSFQLLDDMKNYCLELSDLVMCALNGDFLIQAVLFMQYLVTYVRTIHENDPPSQPVPGT